MAIPLAYESATLWRLTTQPWARSRRTVSRLPQHSMRHVVEAAVTIASMAGMVLLSLACLA
ncbi:MAG TPA: hypothetical protein VFC24_13775 [Casimicrobiaceae bacterium]|nr:hypothetical protein [Casimicrobiaceae bacterium]